MPMMGTAMRNSQASMCVNGFSWPSIPVVLISSPVFLSTTPCVALSVLATKPRSTSENLGYRSSKICLWLRNAITKGREISHMMRNHARKAALCHCGGFPSTDARFEFSVNKGDTRGHPGARGETTSKSTHQEQQILHIVRRVLVRPKRDCDHAPGDDECSGRNINPGQVLSHELGRQELAEANGEPASERINERLRGNR